MMKAILFLLPVLFWWQTGASQSWDWQWGRQFKGADGYYCQVEAIDNLNQAYVLVSYTDTLNLGDTVFAHQAFPNSNQAGVGIFDQEGRFVRAFDFYSTSVFQSMPASVQPLHSNSILIGGTFRNDYNTSDSVLYAPDYSDAYVGLFDNQGRHKWLKTMRGTATDHLISCFPVSPGNIIITGKHVCQSIPGWARFFGADSLYHTGTLIYVMKTDSTGNILWRKDARGIAPLDIDVRNAVAGQDGMIYVQGETYTSLVIGTDTLLMPGPLTHLNFIYSYDLKGNLVDKYMRYWNINIGRMAVDRDGALLFAGSLYNTTWFNNDTIECPANHHPSVIGKVDRDNNLAWYRLFEPLDYTKYHWLDFTMQTDTLFASLVYEGAMVIDTITYSSWGRQALIMQISADGALKNVHRFQGNNRIYSYRSIADHCSNLVTAGMFGGKAFFGQDTLDATGNKSGFLARVTRWANSLDIGPDTTINFNSAVTIQGGTGYDFYRWSTGATTSSIQIDGATLGPGTHAIWLRVSQQGCNLTDTIVVTVRNNAGIETGPSKLSRIEVTPNPCNQRFSVNYQLKDPASAAITLYDFTGKMIDTVLEGTQMPGQYSIGYDCSRLPQGIYLCQAMFGAHCEVRKVVIVR